MEMITHHDWPEAAAKLIEKCKWCDMGVRKRWRRSDPVPYLLLRGIEISPALHLATRNDRRKTALVLLENDDDDHSLATAKDMPYEGAEGKDARAYTCGAPYKYSSENFVGRGDFLDRIAFRQTYHALKFSCPSDQPKRTAGKRRRGL